MGMRVCDVQEVLVTPARIFTVIGTRDAKLMPVTVGGEVESGGGGCGGGGVFANASVYACDRGADRRDNMQAGWGEGKRDTERNTCKRACGDL